MTKAKGFHFPEHLTKMCNPTSRTIILPSVITTKLYQDFDMCMTYLEQFGDAAIIINICNSGGCTETATAMVGRIERSPCLVITAGYGKIYSAAIYVFAAGDERVAHSLASFMHHEPSVGGGGYSTINNLKHDVVQYHKSYEQMCQWIATKSKKSVDFWLKKGILNNDFYFTTKEAIQFGLCEREF